MEFLMILIFAHLMADFVFQTSRIAGNKAKAFSGIIVHVIIVLLTSTMILSIYGFMGILVALIISITHLAIDYLKMMTSKFFRFQIVVYLIDQAFHFGAIISCGYLFRNIIDEPILKLKHIGILNYALIITFMATVIVKIVLTDIYRGKLQSTDFFIKNERILDCLIILIVAFSFINILSGIITLAIATILFYFVESNYFRYNRYQVLLKITLYLLVASLFRFLVKY